ncbi:MAG TPA: DUF5318 domain-containing protein [Candidatus Stackebrandtia excrementipullorum]|nr:DUF5318 domain-containing protein [Candidatus Stackebrandtia excrementipullorum]
MPPISANVDYSLQRRALLRDVASGRVDTHEVCDASPYLVSASRYHGDATTQRCPICRREYLWLVHYIFGDELRSSAGQARSQAELKTLATSYREIDVYVVEVCRGCRWNHLIQRFPLGQDNPYPVATAKNTPQASRDTPRPGRTGTN